MLVPRLRVCSMFSLEKYPSFECPGFLADICLCPCLHSDNAIRLVRHMLPPCNRFSCPRSFASDNVAFIAGCIIMKWFDDRVYECHNHTLTHTHQTYLIAHRHNGAQHQLSAISSALLRCIPQFVSGRTNPTRSNQLESVCLVRWQMQMQCLQFVEN